MSEEIEFEYRLVETLGKDHAKYKALHNELFKGAATSSEWIEWYHKQIGELKSWSKGTRTWGVFDKGELIGIWSVEPKEFRAFKIILQVGRCFAVGIHPNYRRHGLFVNLSKFAIEQEKLLGEYEYILGFPQVGRTVIGGHFKAGWEEVLTINIFSRKNEPRIFGHSRKKANFINNYQGLILESNCDGIVENYNYNNLRWIKHPDHQYLTYSYEDATIVLKSYGNFCHILDITGSIENVNYLLDLSKSLAIKHGWLEMNVWCANKEIYKEAFIASGFSEGAEFGLSVSLIAVRINANKSLKIDYCSIQMGIEEGY